MPSPTISGLIVEDLMASLGLDKIYLFSDFLKRKVLLGFHALWLLRGNPVATFKNRRSAPTTACVVIIWHCLRLK